MAQGSAPPRDPTRVLGRRFAAYLIDGAFLGVIAAVLLATAKHSTYFGAPKGACDGFNPTGTSSICIQSGSHLYLWSRSGVLRAGAFTAVVGFLDLVVLQALTGGSLGKLCVGLRVVDQEGEKANLLQVIARWLFLAVDGGFFLVGIITTLATHPHRRVGDFVGGTYVVATGSVGSPVVGARAFDARAYDPNASWPMPIPPVPTPSPTSQWDSTAAPGPTPLPAPQWGHPPASTPSSEPAPAPLAAPLSTTPEAWARPPVPAPAWPPAPSLPVDVSAIASQPAPVVEPPPAPEPAPPVVAQPEPEPETEPETEPEPVAVAPPPVSEPEPARAEASRPPERSATRQAPTWSSVAPSPQRWSPVAPATGTPAHDPEPVAEAAPESKAEEWWDRALSSDLSEDDSDLE